MINSIEKIAPLLTAVSRELARSVGRLIGVVADAILQAIVRFAKFLSRIAKSIWVYYIKFELSVLSALIELWLIALAARVLLIAILIGVALAYFEYWKSFALYVLVVIFAVAKFASLSRNDIEKDYEKHRSKRAKIINWIRLPFRVLIGIFVFASSFLFINYGGIIDGLKKPANGVAERSSDVGSVAPNTVAQSAGTPAGKAATGHSVRRLMYVNTPQLNVRSGPGLEFDVISWLARGDVVDAYEGKSESGGYHWIRIVSGSRSGWVRGDFLSGNVIEKMVRGAGYIVSPDSFSGVRVGVSVDQAEQKLRIRLIAKPDGSQGCMYVAPMDKNAGFSFMVIDGKIARFDVYGDYASSNQGIKIGDTEEKVIATYGSRGEIKKHPYEDNGHYIEYVDGDYGIVYETDGNIVTSFRSGRLPELRYIEGCY